MENTKIERWDQYHSPPFILRKNLSDFQEKHLELLTRGFKEKRSEIEDFLVLEHIFVDINKNKKVECVYFDDGSQAYNYFHVYRVFPGEIWSKKVGFLADIDEVEEKCNPNSKNAENVISISVSGPGVTEKLTKENSYKNDRVCSSWESFGKILPLHTNITVVRESGDNSEYNKKHWFEEDDRRTEGYGWISGPVYTILRQGLNMKIINKKNLRKNDLDRTIPIFYNKEKYAEIVRKLNINDDKREVDYNLRKKSSYKFRLNVFIT